MWKVYFIFKRLPLKINIRIRAANQVFQVYIIDKENKVLTAQIRMNGDKNNNVRNKISRQINVTTPVLIINFLFVFIIQILQGYYDTF